MRFPPALLDEIVQHARDDLPNECCGIVASDNGEAVRVFRTANAEASPVRYSLNPNEQLRITNEIEDAGWELGAIYHSHTRSEPYPSQTDVNLAFYPDAIYLIVSLRKPDDPEIRAFRIVDEQIEEVTIAVEG
jgi:proteasome lid subunit RPN8/RPN11